MTWRLMMRRLRTPAARAASMNSLPFTASVWPRTMRAMVSHSTAPIAMKIRKMWRPNTTINRITKNMNGNEYMTSTKRIIRLSMRPPK